MAQEPFPEKLIFDENDLPPNSGWSMRRILAALEAGTVPEDFRRFFDRDPERTTPQESGLVVAPADGILELRRREGRAAEFVVHLRLTDVHVQRVPLAGTVVSVRSEGSGFFYPDQEGYWGGVQTATAIDSAAGVYVVRQITTLLTRRIESYLRPGTPATTGQRLGRIRLGSTVVLELPGRWEPLCRDGQKTVAGETPLARLIAA
ncbi:MAG: phosphatidylserine decarboxylase [Elusimicrobia bacterium]|nr:phosphatidylserine decarboxylase [Elusimicrobiota bacterium]